MAEFWRNVARYPQFFITIVLGIFWVAAEPLLPLFKKPVTAVALVTALVGVLAFFALTLQAMLGLAPAA
ncbi:DUF751 family protein [Leptolyngbya sp. FACHB-261]|uniref:DUF751 family protein n=1 Tax=Leptolyngbya sp. FACHB-261 TaxID=2692806 RepID=UPI00168A3612|nr:DUF751 family protein [Leptolyngbya sp. FACHB-261]MBD2102371.1 DUF751 family protein [Leptolyngbya sp. FACHB-261]